ncbi:MAG TPA: Stf0 family sulfotransferase [Methylibium sp.]|nr:Stf0 family sulfotransferase [Methylibium sp.]
MTRKTVAEIIAAHELDGERLAKVEAMPDPAHTYIIATLPRSGSKLLAEVMTETKRLGRPDDRLDATAIRGNLRNAPARNPDEYLRNVLRASATRNGVAGLMTGWQQFNSFGRLLGNRRPLLEARYIHLTRRDQYAQAVSLYTSTAAKPGAPAAAEPDYDYARIARCHERLRTMEVGWQRFFDQHRITPLSITYEDIETDVYAVVKRVVAFLGLPIGKLGAGAAPVLQQRGERSSVVWAARFMLEHDAESRRAAPPSPASP